MKRICSLGMILTLGLVFAMPAFAQGGENNEWQAIQDMKDLRRRAELLDAFIKKNPSSGRRPEADFMLIDFYSGNKDHQKIIMMAEDFRQRPPTSDPVAKGKIFLSAMLAAANLNDVKRTVEYAGYTLDADPNNFSVLSFLAAQGLPDQKKALEYAQRAITLPKPATMTPEAFAASTGRPFR